MNDPLASAADTCATCGGTGWLIDMTYGVTDPPVSFLAHAYRTVQMCGDCRRFEGDCTAALALAELVGGFAWCYDRAGNVVMANAATMLLDQSDVWVVPGSSGWAALAEAGVEPRDMPADDELSVAVIDLGGRLMCPTCGTPDAVIRYVELVPRIVELGPVDDDGAVEIRWEHDDTIWEAGTFDRYECAMCLLDVRLPDGITAGGE